MWEVEKTPNANVNSMARKFKTELRDLKLYGRLNGLQLNDLDFMVDELTALENNQRIFKEKNGFIY